MFDNDNTVLVVQVQWVGLRVGGWRLTVGGWQGMEGIQGPPLKHFHTPRTDDVEWSVGSSSSHTDIVNSNSLVTFVTLSVLTRGETVF